MFVMNYFADNGKFYEIHKCSYGYYAYNDEGNFATDDYFNSLSSIEEYCDSLKPNNTESANVYAAVKQGITAYSAGEHLLHEMCTMINAAYDDADYDLYENLLDLFTDEIHERNWLEDLCTDIRYLGSWSKC